MVRLNGRTRPGPAATVLGLLAGLASVAIGVGLLGRTDSAFGATWAASFVVLGAVVLLSLLAVLPDSSQAGPAPERRSFEGESATFLGRRRDRSHLVGLAVLTLLGGWFAVMGLVGALEQNWVWPVLAAVPALYFLGIPVLAALGRFRPGGVWLTPTRVVDERLGRRSELPLDAVATVTPRTASVHVAPASPGAVVHRRLTPWPWRARTTDDLVLVTDGLAWDSTALAAEVRAAAAAVRR